MTDELSVTTEPEPQPQQTEAPQSQPAVIDVDTSWNPDECSLDEHRQREFAKIKQPGFGEFSKG